MIQSLPIFISVVFSLTTLVTLVLFYGVLKNSKRENTQKNALKISIGLLAWLLIQAVLTLKDVYNADNQAMPPKIVLFGILPAILTIILLFVTVNGRKFIDGLPLEKITYLNIVRIPVELVLFWLFLNKAVPELMTFAGRNFDILAGLTAPFIAYFGYSSGKISKNLILVWNIICFGLLLNIVFLALFSAITPFQKFAFEQPNIAIVNFPFSWLPTFIVPIVLFGHLVSIRQLLRDKKTK
jgi:hypothetical protein